MSTTIRFVRRSVSVGAVTLFMLLLASSQAEAGRPMRSWTRLMFAIDRVCKDGIRLGMANALEATENEKEYMLQFVLAGSRAPLDPDVVYGTLRDVRLEQSDSTFSSPYCRPTPQNQSFTINYCGGPIAVYWSSPPPTGAQLDLWVYAREAYSSEDYVFAEALRDLPSKGFDPLIVDETCSVDEAELAVVQTGPGSDATTVTDALVFEVNASDPDIVASDGSAPPNNGIRQVQFKVMNADGVTLYESVDTMAPFCAFAIDASCDAWAFQERGNRWPTGYAIRSGRLTLQATAFRSYGGGSTTRTWEIELQLPPAARPDNMSPLSVSISAGGAHTCAVTGGRTLKCWGDNQVGQLGNATRSNSLMPAFAHPMRGVTVAASAGAYHTCGITRTGALKCWGANNFGQLGNGAGIDSITPVDVQGLGSDVKAVSAGDYHTCAITSAGGVKCWGRNDKGQLGDGSTVTKYAPVDVAGLGSGVAAIAAGGAHTCALTEAGGLKCWGDNSSGQLGVGSFTNSSVPVDVQGLSSSVMAASAGGGHTCAVTTEGKARCWGSNASGQLGVGAGPDAKINTPVDVQGLSTGVSVISAGGAHTCAVASAGVVKCWGLNNSGQIGIGINTRSANTPVDVQGLAGGMQAVSAGRAHTCVLTSDGIAKCWGSNQAGQLGSGASLFRSAPAGVQGLTTGMAGVAAGADHSCTLTAAGGVKCWGANGSGQLGNGSAIGSITAVDVAGLGGGVTAVAAGRAHTCALTSARAVKCWGDGSSGQLGNDSTAGSSVPVDVQGLAGAVTAISAGQDHTCALTSAGSVQCWGANGNGQLGNGSGDPSDTPVNVTGLSSGVAAVGAGVYHTCVVMTSGAVKCWGANNRGQLGDGSFNYSRVPVDVRGLVNEDGQQDSIAVSAGYDHTCALSSAGGVKCWGGGSAGELGNGTFARSSSPVPVAGLSARVTALSAGNYHTCAITEAGAVQCWGFNASGQGGNSSGVHNAVANAVQGLPGGVTAIHAGDFHTCAVSGGSAVCWGTNVLGQLGNGIAWFSSTPLGVAHHNNYPVAADDAFMVQAASAGNMLDVLANDRIAPDVGETLSIVAVGATDQGGSVSIAGSAVSYTPAAGFVGNERFTYTIDDGKGATATAAVIVSIATGQPQAQRLYLPSILR